MPEMEPEPEPEPEPEQLEHRAAIASNETGAVRGARFLGPGLDRSRYRAGLGQISLIPLLPFFLRKKHSFGVSFDRIFPNHPPLLHHQQRLLREYVRETWRERGWQYV